jgi:hypothetical protein
LLMQGYFFREQKQKKLVRWGFNICDVRMKLESM